MRPPAIEKMGYYETSIRVAQLLKTYFKPAESGRLLDPCAGEGIAASILAKALNCQSWGAELSPARAALAVEKMDRLFNTPWQSCHLTNESITLLFLNPPYSHDRLGDQKRLELEFLKSTTPKLIRNGVLVYIVPHQLLRDLDVASHLAGYYENITVYRYPETGFNQVIVLAVKRIKFKMPSNDEVMQVQGLADIEPPMLSEVNEPMYQLLPASDKGAGGQPTRFSRLDWQPEEIVDATQKRGVHSTKEWLDLLNPSRGLGEFKQPVMPLKKGHIAMLMASGMMGTLRLNDDDGKPMLVKGRVVKVTEKVEEITDKKGNTTSEVFRDRFVSTVAILRQSGIEIIDTVEPLSKFMHKYGDQLGAHILSTYRPLYNFDPTPEEIAVLDTLGTKRKPLPGQEKAGLLPAQRHAVAAMARSIRKHGVGNVQGEMGLGKAQPLNAKIYTPHGYKLMGHIAVGDQVINPEGGYANVVGVYPQGEMDIYRVTFSDGSTAECTEDHLWDVRSPLRKWKGRPRYVKTLRQIMKEPLAHPTTGNYQVFIPMTRPVEFGKRNLPLDPYLLGVLLGDGGLSGNSVLLTSADEEILDQVRKYLPNSVTLKATGSSYGWRISCGKRFGQNPVRDHLREFGLAGEKSPTKFIPVDYLYSDFEDRLALLQGLLDTDGSVSNGRAIEYSSTSLELANGVKELAQSLGGTVTTKIKHPTYTHKGEKRNGRLAYRLYIKLHSDIMPFRLSRKANVYQPKGKYEPHRSIVKIEHVGKNYAQCIMLDSENQLYVTDEYIVTHNTTIGSGVVELLDAYPAIVLCPPHLVPKWIREIEETVPGAKAMELTRIGRNANDPGDVNDVRNFLQRYKDGELGQKPVAIIAHTSAKYGAGWEHAVVSRKFVDDEDGRVFEALTCPTCGSPIQIDLPGGFIKVASTIEDLGDKRRFCIAKVSGYELDDHKRLVRDEHSNPVWGKRICGTPLFQFTGRRWAIADYIAKQAKDRFKMLVADECLVRDTMIETKDGPKFIQDIQVGDDVLSFNHTTHQTEYKKVLHTMKNLAPNQLIKVAGLVCTPNHPIFTKEENYAEAQKVGGKKVFVLRKDVYGLRERKEYSKILLQILRIFRPSSGNKPAGRRQATQTNGGKDLPSMWKDILPKTYGAIFRKTKILFPSMQSSILLSGPRGARNAWGQDSSPNEGNWEMGMEWKKESSCRRTDAEQQPNEKSRDQGESKKEIERKNVSLPWWKWNTHQAASNSLSGTWFARDCDGVCDQNCKGETGLSTPAYLLQSRYRYPGGYACHRGGWTNSHIEEMEISGPPQNGGLEFSRVDRVEILEQGSGSGFGEVCPDGHVYNFEVDGNNNYFANGVLVHNCHQFKSKSSDRGIAFHQLVGATKYTLTLTGTFFGGKSTSIFWLLHRLNAGVRKDFAFDDEKRWARLYGVLELTRKSKRAEEDGDEDGFTGNRRYQNQAKEQPSISPAIVNRLLDTTVFLSLKDLGLSLPHYAEEVVTLTMTDKQSSQYRSMAKKLRDLAIKNRRYLSSWLQWTLARPNSAFRDEVVEIDEVDRKGEFVRRRELMELPAVVDDETMPKESWLVDFCRSERQQGRKVLIYLRQTGTRDIQDRILKVLRDGGVRAEVLTSGVNPRKREEWIAKRVVGLDALVVNPKLVETGLDLIAFSSVVFAEIEYSLYTLWQAVRRVWRLGQTKPVKAIFSVYSEAMEARALALMGQKMKAAQLLYGDEVGGAIVPEEDGDILMKLAREALESADLPDLQSLFADDVIVSNSPLGCPTAPSTPLPVPDMPKAVSWSDWMTQKGAVGRSANRPRSKQVTQNQVSLF